MTLEAIDTAEPNVLRLSIDQFESRFAEEIALVTSRGSNKYSVGDRVEALAGASTADTHSLFYAGEVLEVQPDGRLKILYEDGSEETDIAREFVRPYKRTEVWEDDEVRVLDGHISVCGECCEARLLAFKSSPHLFQSAVMLAPDGTPLHRDLPFEQHQVLAFAMPFAQPEGDRARMALIGAGGGTLPMALQTCFPGALDMDVVELSRSVVTAATQYFGLIESDHLRVHTEDGVQFISRAEAGTYDILIVDAADPDAPNVSDMPDGLEVPPPAFVDPDFFSGPLRKCLTSKGVFCMNILAGRQQLMRLAMLFEEVFASVYIQATDPNYFFWGFVEKTELTSENVVQLVTAVEGLEGIVIDALVQVRKTSANIMENTLLGWYDVPRFVSMCQNEDVVV